MSVIATGKRIRFIPGYPLSIVEGGFEHQCVQTVHALRLRNYDARILDWGNSEDDFDLLHLFGGTAAWHGLTMQAKVHRPYVVTMLGQHRWPWTARLVNGAASKIAATMFSQRTEFGMCRQMLQSASAVVFLNEIQRNSTVIKYVLNPKRTVIIPNGLPLSRYNGDSDGFWRNYGMRDYVLFVGNIVERKNPLLLAKILSKRQWPGVFVGGTVPTDRNYAERFQRFIDSQPNLKWVRPLKYDDPKLDDAFAGAKVFCLPSVMESQPLSAMEAMAANIPVLMPDLGYAKQAPFEGIQRYRANDNMDLETNLQKMLKSPDAYRQRLPRTFSWDSVAQQLISLYENILEQRQ